jgi:hypothetical protein
MQCPKHKGKIMISNNDFALISALDFESIKVKLMHKESGEAWSLEHANAMEIEYRRFLYLMKAFPSEQTAPLEDVDTFWHYHILDTMKYARDCEAVFGYFLHHYPYLGMVGENGLEILEQAGDRTRELYEATFGESYLRAFGAAEAGSNGVPAAAEAGAAWCGRAPVEAGSAQHAWCGRAPELAADAAKAAWCGRAPVKVDGSQAAWCGRAPAAAADAGTSKTAWCGRAPVKAEGTQTAWCGRAPELAADAGKAAWCGRAPMKADAAANTAWCRRAPVEVQAAAVQSAWCGRAPALALAA